MVLLIEIMNLFSYHIFDRNQLTQTGPFGGRTAHGWISASSV